MSHQGDQTSESIEFRPHLELLFSGKSHFFRPVDAIAEYIDNSIQACIDSHEPQQIRICVFLGSASLSQGFFLILDNGAGMDVQGIKEFATYALDQKTRNRAPAPGDKSFIGKFGVGAKQAGFYLGTRIKLFTRPIDRHDRSLVLTFCLDRKDMLQKHETNQDVYSGLVRKIDLEQSSDNYLERDERVFPLIGQILQNHFSTVPHGTAFLVRLRPDEIVPKLKAMLVEDTLKKQINDIYHFHLHPEHCPKTIVNTLNSRDLHASSRASSSSSRPLKIIYERCTVSSRQAFNLYDECDFFQQCMTNKAADIFTIDIETSLPSANVDTTSSQSSYPNKHIIRGFFFYFPFKDGKEMIPRMDEGTDDAERSNQHPIYIYWQDRLVPDEDKLFEMFFFPKTTASRSEIARNWRDRIVGFLFFDWEFDLIANNKLKFRIDLHDWFNRSSNLVEITTNPKGANRAFLNWLVKCHKEDLDYVFSNRDLSQDTAECSIFRSFTLEHKNFRIEVGNNIKLKPATKNGPVIYGEVCAFVVEKPLFPHENTFFGHGEVRYKRLPLELFGSREEKMSVTFIDGLVESEDLAELNREIPSSVNVYLFERASDEGRPMHNDIAELLMGFKYFKIGVQIKNKDGNLVHYLPDSGNDKKSIRYRVSMRNSDGKDYGKTENLWKYDESSDKDVSLDRIPNANRMDFFYGVYDITMPRRGPMSFFISVYSPYSNTPIFEKEVRCKVVTMPPVQFEIAEKELFAQLGQPFPSFKVKFLDCKGQCVPFEGEVMLEMKSERMQATKPLVRKMTHRDEDGLICNEGDWVVSPKPGTTIFSTKTVEAEKDVKFSLSLFTRNAKNNRFESFCFPIEFKVRFSPGLPAKLAIMQPSTQPVIVESGGALNVLHVAMLDQWGHRVAPKTTDRQWSLRLGDGPLILPSNVKSVFPTNGELQLLNILCRKVNETSTFKQSLHLYRSGTNSSQQEEFQSAELQIKVSAANCPSSIKIFMNDEELSQSITCKAGEKLSNLSFAVYNENGEEIDLSLQSFESSWIECDWTLSNRGNKNKRSSISTNQALPHIDIPQDISESPFEPSVTVALDSRVLNANLNITIVPEPAMWFLVCSPDLETLGLVADESGDLQKKIRGAVWIDKFGNHMPCDSQTNDSSAALAPFLEVFALNADEMDLDAENIVESSKPLHSIPLQSGQVQMCGKEPLSSKSSGKKRTRSSDANVQRNLTESDHQLSVFQGFVVPSPLSLEFPPDCREVVLRVVDDSRRLGASEPQMCRLVKSLPKKVLLSCEAFGVSQPASELSVTVPSFSSISDLRIHVCDAHGDEASLQDISAVKIEVVEGKNKIFSRNNMVSTSVVHAALNYDFASAESSFPGDCIVEFECRMSCRRGKELIVLSPARLSCKVKKLNNVIDMNIRAFQRAEGVSSLSQAQEVPLLREHNTFSLSVPCDIETPLFALLLVTNDGRPFLPSADNFQFTAKRFVDKVESNLVFEEFLNFEVNEDNSCLTLKPTEQLQNQEKQCNFVFEIVYKENRIAFNSLPEEKKLSKIQLHMHFVSGSLMRLNLDNQSLKKIENKSVSNSAHQQFRLFSNDIVLHGSDAYGNIATFSPTHEVRCRVVATKRESLNKFRADAALPRLSSADERGFIKAVMEKNGKEFRFPEIELAKKQNTKCSPGYYLLRFSLCETTKTSPDADKELLPVHVEFKFTSDETNVRILNELHSQIEPLRTKKEEYNTWENQHKALNLRLCELQTQCSPEVKEMNVERLRQLLANRELDVQQNKQCRPAKKPLDSVIDPVALDDKEVLGRVLDLGFVNDFDEAKVLSWASGEVIDAVAVRDSSTAMKLYKSNIKALFVSPFIPFTTGGKATRTNQNKNKNVGMPDLPAIIMSPIPTDRQPRYLVNLIRLDPKHEELRATLFYKVFSDSLLFHSMEDAYSYREKLLEAHKNPPTLYTMQGEKIERNGLYDPGPSGQMPADLNFIYGEQKTKGNEKNANLNIDLLEEIIKVVEEIQSTKNKMEAMNITDIDGKIIDLEGRINGLYT